MKLVLLYLGKRGAGPVYSIEFAKALLERGVSILAIVSNNSENVNQWTTLSRKFEKLELKTINTYKGYKGFIIKSLNIFGFARLAYLIREYAPGFVFTPMIHPWHNILIAMLPEKIKRIKVIHDVSPHLGESNTFSILLSKVDIGLSDVLVVLSQYSKKQLVNNGIKKDIIVIPHANFNYYSRYIAPVTPKQIYYRIGFFGRINKYKGLDILLKSWETMISVNSELKLLIAGNGDCSEYVDSFDQYKDSLELHNRWISDKEVACLLSCVDLIILPYIEASQSGVIPLALALGKPVIVTGVGGLKEQVPLGCGLIIPANDSKALSDVVMKLYDNPTKILEMGVNARKYANEALAWDKSADILLDHLKFYK